MSSNDKSTPHQKKEEVTGSLTLTDDVASPSSVVGAHFPNTRRRMEETSPEKGQDNHHPTTTTTSATTTGETDADDEEESITIETLLSHNRHKGDDGHPHQDDADDDDQNPAGDEGDAHAAEKKKGVLPSRYYRQIRTRRGEVAARVNQRMEEATRRREELLQQRKQHLIDVERRRQQKVHQVKGMRLAALGALIRKGLEPLNHLQRAGLHVNVAAGTGGDATTTTSIPDPGVATLDALEQQLTPDAIEMILVSDRRACDICEEDLPTSVALENKAKPVCPHTNKPHRRSLVVAAEKFLKLVGDTRVNLVGSRLETVGSSTPAAARQKVKRGIAVNPQLFVLSYYTSVLPVGEVDSLLKEYAASLVYATEQLRAALLEANHDASPSTAVPAGDGEDVLAKSHEAYLKPLLQSFARAWRRYSQLSDQQILQNISSEGRESATQELLQSTVVALESTYRKLADTASTLQALQNDTTTNIPDAQSSSDERTIEEGGRQLRIARLSQELAALSAFVAMLRTRLSRIGGAAALGAFDEKMQRADQERLNSDGADGNAIAAPTDDYSDYTPERQRNADASSAAPSYFTNGAGGGTADRSLHRDPVVGSIHNDGPASPVIASPLLTSVPPNTPALPATTSARTGGGGGASAFARAISNDGPSSSSSTTVPAATANRPAYSRPKAPEEYVGTSGSDSDLGSSSMSPSRAQGTSFGPELPPLWYVDGDGKSKPPSEETVRREEHSKLEYRARSAYTAKMKRDAMKTKAEEEWRDAADQLSRQFDDAMWVQVASELDAQPPVVHRLPNLLSAVAESLIDALPRRIRNKIGQEIRDVLDWGLLRRQLATAPTEKRVESIVSLMIYVVNRVGQLGAPAKEEALKEEAQALAAAAKLACESTTSTPSSSVGTAVVAIFRFMFSAIQELRKDIAEYSLKLVSHELVENAVKYETAFVDAVLPAPPQWNTTKQFLITSISEAKTAPCLIVPPNLVDAVLRSTGGAGPSSTSPSSSPTPPHIPGTPLNISTLEALPPSTLYLTNSDKETFAGLVFGLVDLIRTGGKLAEARWAGYPKEAFYFARPLIFECANSVQLLTLRLMISGTVSMILAPAKLHATPLQNFLQDLDTKAQKWLGKVANSGQNNKKAAAVEKEAKKEEGEEDNDHHEPDIKTIEDIKDAVVEEVHYFLASGPQQQPIYTSTTSAAAQAARASGAPQVEAQLPPLELGESDEAVLRNVLGKLTDTTGTQYVTFEGRILRAIFGVLLESVATQSSGINSETSATSSASAAGTRFNPKLRAGSAVAQRSVGGLVLEGVKEAGALLAAVLLHNWAVYRHYYQAVLPPTTTTDATATVVE